MTIPITVFTGFLGAGKTSLILSLLPQLPQGYRACLLKNEFGDVEVDSQLAKQSSLAGVNEMLNGCMCCVLVGQMENALLEIKEKYAPDRIFVETSGSAFPATLAFQIRKLEKDTNGELKLDAIVTVIDAENFMGYEDTSPTAKMQASYTDLIVINKWESLSERQLDLVLDHLHTLNDLTPKVKTNGKKGIDPKLIFGIDSKLLVHEEANIEPTHNEEVQTATIWRGGSLQPSCTQCTTEDHCHHDHHEHGNNDNETSESANALSLTYDNIKTLLSSIPKDSGIWRIKGFIKLISSPELHVINWSFGRFDFEPFRLQDAEHDSRYQDINIRLTIMGEPGEVLGAAKRLAKVLGAEVHGV